MSKFFRSFFTVILSWFFCLLTIAFIILASIDPVFAIVQPVTDGTGYLAFIIPVIIVIIFLAYMYGKIGYWLHRFKNYHDHLEAKENNDKEDSFFRDVLVPLVKSLVGMVGYIFFPLIVIVGNGTKKKSLITFCAIPMLLLAGFCIFLAFSPSTITQLEILYNLLYLKTSTYVLAFWITVAVTLIVNAIMIFTLTTCNKCGHVVNIVRCLETEKKYKTISSIDTKYSADKSYREFYVCKNCDHSEELKSSNGRVGINKDEYSNDEWFEA